MKRKQCIPPIKVPTPFKLLKPPKKPIAVTPPPVSPPTKAKYTLIQVDNFIKDLSGSNKEQIANYLQILYRVKKENRGTQALSSEMVLEKVKNDPELYKSIYNFMTDHTLQKQIRES